MSVNLYTSPCVNPSLFAIGDSRNGLKQLTSPAGVSPFTEMALPLNQPFIVEEHTMFLPLLGFNKSGFKITFLTPGWNYKSRVSVRPTFVPRTQIFIDPFGVNTIEEAYEYFNTFLDEDTSTNVEVRGVQLVSAYGEYSYGKLTAYDSVKKYLISTSGIQFARYFEFPSPSWTPDPESVTNGYQLGSLVQFFTEDQFSLALFNVIAEFRTNSNTMPNL